MSDDDEPLLERTMSVVGMGEGGQTPYVSPTSVGAELAGISLGDDVCVRIYDGGVWIETDDE